MCLVVRRSWGILVDTCRKHVRLYRVGTVGIDFHMHRKCERIAPVQRLRGRRYHLGSDCHGCKCCRFLRVVCGFVLALPLVFRGIWLAVTGPVD